LNQAIDTTTPAGRLHMHMLAAIAEYERASIQDRVRAGLARVRAAGVTLGRPKHTAAVQLETAAGLSHAAAAEQLGVSVASIKRWRKTERGSKTLACGPQLSPAFVGDSGVAG
jgi:DNA invertase Pin-like site-specific DNA recombinase